MGVKVDPGQIVEGLAVSDAYECFPVPGST